MAGSNGSVPPNFFEQLFASGGTNGSGEVSSGTWSPIAVRGYVPPTTPVAAAPLSATDGGVSAGGGNDGYIGPGDTGGYSPALGNGGTPDFADSTGSIGGDAGGGSGGGGK